MTQTTSKVFAGALTALIFAALFIALAGSAEAAGTTCVRPAPFSDSQLRFKFNSMFR